MEKGGGGRYEDAEHHGRDGYGQATVEEAHIPSSPVIRNKWMLNDDDDDDDDDDDGSPCRACPSKSAKMLAVWQCFFPPSLSHSFCQHKAGSSVTDVDVM